VRSAALGGTTTVAEFEDFSAGTMVSITTDDLTGGTALRTVAISFMLLALNPVFPNRCAVVWIIRRVKISVSRETRSSGKN
jgi:hypothetical protein